MGKLLLYVKVRSIRSHRTTRGPLVPNAAWTLRVVAPARRKTRLRLRHGRANSLAWRPHVRVHPDRGRYRVERGVFETEIIATASPVVLKELVADWPFVRAARDSRVALAGLIKGLDAGRQPHVIETPAGMNGRIFYSDDLAGFNFTRRPAGLSATIDRLLALAGAADAPAIFLESMSGKAYLPGFPDSHRMPLLDESAEPRIWIGNAVR